MTEIVKNNFKIIVLLVITSILHADSAPEYSYTLIKKTIATASSILIEPGKDKNRYSAEKAFDGKKETAWCEGQEDDGLRESIELKFKPTVIDGFLIAHGVLLSKEYYNLNNRIKDYELIITKTDGSTEILSGNFKDTGCEDGCNSMDGEDEYKICQVKNKNKCDLSGLDGYRQSGGESIVFNPEKYECIKGIKIKILSVFPGKKYKDTCISEILLRVPQAMSEGTMNKIAKAQKACK